MEQLKNIVLGLLIGVVICMSYHIHTLKQQINHSSYTETRIENRDPMIMFNRFFDMVLEFEARKKLQDQEDDKNHITTPESKN